MGNFAVSASDEIIAQGKNLLEKLAEPGDRQGDVLGRIFKIVEEQKDGETMRQGGVDVQALDSSLSNIRNMFLTAVTGKEQIVASKDSKIAEVKALKDQMEKDLRDKLDVAKNEKEAATVQAETAAKAAAQAVKDAQAAKGQAETANNLVAEKDRTIAEAVGSAAWLPRYRAYAGFVFDKPDSQEVRLLPSISWTNGLAAAVPMLEASLRLHREDLRNQALQCISHIVQTSINPRNGLPFTAEIEGTWCNRGWWYDTQPVPGHAAYLVGQAVYLILKAYMFEEQLSGEKHGDWLEYARKVLFVTEQSRNGDGEYPYIFSEETGAGLCYDSLSGAWCLAAAALYCALSGETGRLVDLMDSERYYYRAFVSRMECYGGPLDIDKQTDSEGILAYIRAVRWLHEITREPELLDHMRDALEYEFTFKFCYNSPIKVPPLSRVGWSSCGGSITSVCNPHIHPMSSSVIDELLYYTEQTGDEYIRSRLEDTILWSCQVSNTRDREYDYGKTGWMSERFCHSEGLLTETYPDGSPASTWFALMPWACGCILEGLAGDWWDLDK